jgi:hypothetical protein
MAPKRVQGIVRPDGVNLALLTLKHPRVVTSVLRAIENYNFHHPQNKVELVTASPESAVITTFNNGVRMHDHVFYLEIAMERQKSASPSTYWEWIADKKSDAPEEQTQKKRIRRKRKLDREDDEIAEETVASPGGIVDPGWAAFQVKNMRSMLLGCLYAFNGVVFRNCWTNGMSIRCPRH